MEFDYTEKDNLEGLVIKVSIVEELSKNTPPISNSSLQELIIQFNNLIKC